MESDFSLIEISGEDDSLLHQQLPVDDISPFASSPLHLQIPKCHSISSSPLSLSSSSTTSAKCNTGNLLQGRVSSHSNKENLYDTDIKFGGPNLSVEPQKMKRSKKCSGYNLRKSLAWDRAFLTEEGVLNDSELSMISGTVGDRESLSVIDQEGRDSLPTNYSTVSSSADKATLEEDIFKELSSSCPNKRNSTSSSDSLNGGSLAFVSKSSKKVYPGHGLKKIVCKGEVSSSPMASASQKRLLNTGTKTNLTRNSKIPKVPVSMKNSSVPSMTPIHRAKGGSSFKSTEIAQPVPRKSLSSNLSSKLKHASGATKLLEPLPKFIKPCADVTNNVTNSALQMHSPMGYKAQHTTQTSQDLLSGVANSIKSSDEISSIAALTHVHSDNTGLKRKNVQVLGLKPSGLRMPSPSLRFFSETKAPVSNTSSQFKVTSAPLHLLKSNIPPSRTPEIVDHSHDLKPTQLLHGAPNVDSMGKAGSCSLKTNKCSTLSIVVPKVYAKKIQDSCKQEIVELRVPQGNENSEPTNIKQLRSANLDGFKRKYDDQDPTSLEIEEKGTKDNSSVSTHVEYKSDCSEATILFQETRTADKRILDGSSVSCPEVKFTVACETKTEAPSQVLEDVELTSSITDHDIILDLHTNSDSRHKNMILISHNEPPRSVLDDDKSPDESNCGNSDQTSSQRSMEMQLDERKLLGDGSSVELAEDDPDVPVYINGVLAVEDAVSNAEVTGICDANVSVAVRSKNGLVDDEQGDVTSDGKLSIIKLSENSDEHDKVIENHDIQKRTSTNFGTNGNEDMCTVSLEVMKLPSQRASTIPELINEDPDEFFHLCNSDQDGEQSQSSIQGIADNCASVHGAPTSNYQCTEITKDTYTVVDKQQILNTKMPTKEMMLQSNKANLCRRVFENSCQINEEKTHARISDDIDEVSNSLEEVKGQVDFLSCLPMDTNDSTLQTTHRESQSSGMRSKDQNDAANPHAIEYLCSVNKQELPPRDVSMTSITLRKYIESDKDEFNHSTRKPGMAMSQQFDAGDECTYKTEGIDGKEKVTEKRTNDQKLTRPPPNVVPFSDEWLAALESAGEEILTLKTGAVKHSPPDKSIPEPGPWSPVKRKSNQIIGPFDCTKYTNI